MVDQWSSSSSGFSLWVYSVTDVRNSCERPRAVGHKYLKPGNQSGRVEAFHRGTLTSYWGGNDPSLTGGRGRGSGIERFHTSENQTLRNL